MPQDFSYQNLLGRSFKDQDLSGANFARTDIRGTDFTRAKLIGANFRGAQAGLQQPWVVGLAIRMPKLGSKARNYCIIDRKYLSAMF